MAEIEKTNYIKAKDPTTGEDKTIQIEDPEALHFVVLGTV